METNRVMGRDPEIAISVNNLSKVYKLYKDPKDRLKESLNFFGKIYHTEFYALEDLTLSIKKGEIVGIIGKNGSGKSTLLKILTGVSPKSSGSVNVHGKISALLELGAGLNPEKSGIENIYFSGTINDYSAAEMDNKVQEIIDFADIGDFIYQPIKTYSSGMRARLAFSLAIHIDPEILIIDEILSVGDAAFQRKCFAKIEQFKKQDKTILLVSHSEPQIVEICDRAVWISEGKKVIEGDPKIVTGLYLKYSSNSSLDMDVIRLDHKNLVENSEKKKVSNISDHKKGIADQPQKNNFDDIFMPSLKPKSTIFYEDKGARIIAPSVTTLDGRKVNLITQGKDYLYQYTVVFDNDVNKVLLAMMIRSKSGINLGGGHYPRRKKYTEITSKEIKITWKWKCNLIQGDYFFNCGVSDENGFLARVLDATMIRVRPSDEKLLTSGIIDFDISASVSP